MSVTVHGVTVHVLATCVLLFVTHAAAAQSGSMVDPRAPGRVQTDSVEPYPQLTLGEVVARAQIVSPTVAMGVGGVINARSALRVARGTYLPIVALTSTVSSTDQPLSAGGGAGGAGGTQTTGGGSSSSSLKITNFATIGIGATIDVFTGGKRRAINDAARAGLLGADWTLDSARYAARFNAESTFYALVRARDLVQVARSGLAEAELLVRYTRDMLRAGTAMRANLLSAQVQAATFQTQLLAANDTLITAAYALGWLTGANGPVGARMDSESEAIRPLALDDSVVVRLAVEWSPMVVGAYASLAASEARLRAARTLYIPQVTASAVYNMATIPVVAIGSGAVLATPTGSSGPIAGRPGWIVSLGTTYPLFNAYQREDSVTRAETAVALARSVAYDAARSARSSAARLLTTLRTTAATITLETEAVRSARENLRVQLARYRAGIGTLLDVLTSQFALVQAGYSLALARYQFHTARAALETLVGRVL